MGTHKYTQIYPKKVDSVNMLCVFDLHHTIYPWSGISCRYCFLIKPIDNIMSLKKINEGEVVSSKGFSIRIRHNRLAYFEGKKAAHIDIEHCVDPYKIAVYSNTIEKWLDPYGKNLISVKDKSTIVDRIKECLDFLGVYYVFEQAHQAMNE